MGMLSMSKFIVVSANLPIDVYREFSLRVSEGERSSFIQESLFEKREKTSRPDKIRELKRKFNNLENELDTIKNYLVKLEILTHESGKVNPHSFCIDETDNNIVDYLVGHRGATTTELA
jgi:predicted nucleotide-binding protein (sugar kinase/HSP70/actin superfamily)